jgi:hypothetical protein
VAGLGDQKVVPVLDDWVLADPHDHPALVNEPQDQAGAFGADRAQRPADGRGVRADLLQAVLLGVDELEDEVPRVRGLQALGQGVRDQLTSACCAPGGRAGRSAPG